MTILSFADTRFPIERANGLQTMATCQALAARGHDVVLVVRPDTESPARDPFVFYDLPPTPTLTIRTIPAAHESRARRIRYLAAAVALTARHRGAVVFTRDLGIAAALLQRLPLRHPRVVYESHGLSDVVARELPRLLDGAEPASDAKIARLERRERRVWHEASAYVTITHALAAELAHRYGGRAEVFVVPDGARPCQPTPPPEALVAGYAGHLYPWKGVDVFVRALALAPAWRGLIVGGHPREADRARVEALAAELGVRDRLEITGLLAPRDVSAALQRASVLVLPNTASAISERYTSPLKLFEYLAVGRPIVASDLPSLREVLTDERTALLVPPGDAAALAAALDRLAHDPSLSAALRQAALHLAPSFTWEERARRLEPALEAAARA